MTEWTPTYVQLLESGEFERRVVAAYDLLSHCHVCAWHCPVDRRAGKLGVCKTGVRARVSSEGPHMGEEEPLRLLDGVIDIYMPDMKYADAGIARQYSKIPDYPRVNREAVREMHRQVGDLQLDEHGLVRRGLLVRRLVLPNGLSGTEAILRFLVEEISPNTYLNLMDQYRPAYKAHRIPDLNRPLTRREFDGAVVMAWELGLHRLDRRRAFRWLG